MSTAWSPMRSRQRETISIRRPQRALEVVGDREHLLDRPPVRPVDQLVELDERLGPGDVPRGERVDATRIISSARAPISPNASIRPCSARQLNGQLDELRDRHAVVGHALEVEVDVQDREHEPQVGGDRGLAREQVLDALLDLEIAASTSSSNRITSSASSPSPSASAASAGGATRMTRSLSA